MRNDALHVALAVLKQPGITPTLREAAVRLSDAARNRGVVIIEQRLREMRERLGEFKEAREVEIDSNAAETASMYGRA
jgi:hypothetical protein